MMKRLIAITLSLAMIFAGFAYAPKTVKADYVREYTTVGSGNGWQYMTINANDDNDGPRETFQVEGGTSWNDLPTFTWYGYPLHPFLTPNISPTDPMTAGIYANNVMKWNVIAYFFKSPVYTVQTSGTHTVKWNAIHNLSVYNTATRYYIQLVDANTGEVLYTNPKCVNCSSGENCEACERFAQYGHNYEFVEQYQCDDTCTCCEDGERNRFNYFGEYVNGEEQPITFDVDLQAGQQVQILYARNNGSQLTVTEASIEEPKVYHNVVIEGKQTYQVEHGTEFTLPEGVEYGYLIDGQLYPAGYKITVNSDITATPIETLSLQMAPGATIRTGPPAGIGFIARVNTNQKLLQSNAYKTGMLITCEDIYIKNGEKLDCNSDYMMFDVANDGWLDNVVGTYRCGVINIKPYNYTRDFISRGYIKLNYVTGETRIVYSPMSAARNIVQVARSMIAADDEDVNDFIREIAAFED